MVMISKILVAKIFFEDYMSHMSENLKWRKNKKLDDNDDNNDDDETSEKHNND